MRKLSFLVGLLICGLLVGTARAAETFKLTNGETVTGEVLIGSANDQGVQIKVGEGQYQKVSWGSFSQDDLKTFAKTAKLEPFVEPFIEITQAEKIKKTEVNIKQPPRLERPQKQSLIAALFSSSVGVFLLLMIYAANVYAGYEVAIFRAQNVWLVAGLAAIPVLGFLSPIVFLALPTKTGPSEPAVETVAEPVGEDGQPVAAAVAAAEDDVNPMRAEGAQHPSALHLHAEAKEETKPQTTVFQRGQFTFNRRFFETKFAPFFGTVRREHDRNLVMVVKSTRGEFIAQRISRIAANDMHIQVQKGAATEEVMIGFQEIKEVQLKS